VDKKQHNFENVVSPEETPRKQCFRAFSLSGNIHRKWPKIGPFLFHIRHHLPKVRFLLAFPQGKIFPLKNIMSIHVNTNTLYPPADTPRLAEQRSRLGTVVQTDNSTVEKKEDDKQWSPIFSSQKQLTPEEQLRVEFLKNLLLQTLSMAQGDPTEDQKKQIKEIENELEKITGVKMRTKVSSLTDKLPGNKDDDKEEEKRQRQAKGMDPKEASHNNVEIKEQKLSPGMQMLRNNAFSLNLGQRLLTSMPSGAAL